MKRPVISRLLPVLLLAATLALSACSQPPREPLGPNLVEGDQLGHEHFAAYREALAESARSGKAVMLLFSAPEWCGACKTLEKNVMQNALFKQYQEKRLILLVYTVPQGQPETPEEKKVMFLADAMHVDGVPTILVVNHQGREVVRRSYGGSSAKSFIDLIEKRIQRTGALDK